MSRLYGSATGLNFASWMAFNVPVMIINTTLAWLWLNLLFIGWKPAEGGRDRRVEQLIRRKYQDLGPMSFQEAATLFLFVCLVLLWFFRDPQFITGWRELIPAV